MLTESEVKVTEINCAIIRLIENDIVHIAYKENHWVQVDDFREAFAVYDEYASEKPMRILVELPTHSSATSEAAKFAEKQTHQAIAEAVFIHTMGQRLLIRFYILFHKKRHPMKIFTNKENAIEWLNSIE